MFETSAAEMILVVDDDPDTVAFMVKGLEAGGFTVLTAGNGKEGLELLARHSVFLVLSDLRMPILDGLEFCRAVRLQRPTLPFVLISGFADKEASAAALRVGVTDLLDKPVRLQSLIAIATKTQTERKEELAREVRETRELRTLFVGEAKDLTSDLETSILALELDDPEARDVDRLFRRLHTLKGSSGTVVGAENLTRLSHAFETVLTSIKSGVLTVDENLIDTLLACGDTLVTCVRALEANEAAPPVDDLIDSLVAQGVRRQSAKKTDAAKGAPPTRASAPAEDGDEGVLVPNEKLDGFMKLAGELVAFKNTFDGLARHLGNGGDIRPDRMENMNRTLNKITDQIQAQITEIRKVLLSKAFAKFPRVVRQVAAHLGKQVRLDLVGQDLAVDKTIAKALASSLIHAVRNACDHGIEMPDVRQAKGKDPTGRIAISASQRGDVILVTIEDDGAGIDRKRVLTKAIERNLIEPGQAALLADDQVIELLFLPGFSTAEAVSDVSGRGVGMDAVKSAVLNLGGTAELRSDAGRSTTLALTIPAPKTVVVEQSLLAATGNVLLAIPLGCISDIRPIRRTDLTFVGRTWTCQHRDRTIPVGRYDNFLASRSRGAQPTDTVEPDELLVVISHKDRYVGLRIDRLVDQLEAVIRPFDEVVGEIDGFRGTSQLPNDDIAYVISPEQMLDLVSA